MIVAARKEPLYTLQLLPRVRMRAFTHPPLRAAGFDVEPAAEDPARKVVVTFPVDAGAGVRTLDDVSMWEQFSLAALLAMMVPLGAPRFEFDKARSTSASSKGDDDSAGGRTQAELAAAPVNS